VPVFDGVAMIKFKWKKFSQHVREERKKFGYGVPTTARALKIPQNTWVRAEHGHMVDVPLFLLLCDWMHRDPHQYAVRRVHKRSAFLAELRKGRQ
jgi:hypothetical protein